jgi:outer membrane receptor for ferrienterochelin and colicins
MIVLLAFMLWPALAGAQSDRAVVRVDVRSGGEAVPDAAVIANTTTQLTDREGRALLTVAPGSIDIVVTKDGYLPSTSTLTLQAGDRRDVTIELRRLEEEVFVTATRSGTRLQDQPLRVEVIDREEIEEKALMTPGSVAMLVSETTGLRVQTTAPSLGAANVRIQGLRGRYSQLLADGLPLYGTQGDSFSLLQVPPLDLGQVEVIKGVASALYGASALGGVINLVSRRPRIAEQQLLVNATSQTGRDVVGWYAHAPVGPWSWSLLGSYNGQTRRDLDEDGWSDLPNFNRGVARPRIFFDNQKGDTAFATLGVIVEDREGGTLAGRTAPDGRPFEEALATRHLDGGFVGRWLTSGNRILSLRGSAQRQAQSRLWGDVAEHGTRSAWFGEASLQGVNGRHTWVIGSAFQQDRFTLDEIPAFDYRFSAPAVFGQDEISFGRKWTLGVSARADVHSEYGTLSTPRVSFLARPWSGWTIRVAAGTGAFAPTPFTEETEETGLSRLLPLRGVRAEWARGTSVDVTRVLGPVEVTGTVFGSTVDNPLQQRIVDRGRVMLVNVDGPTRTVGTELLLRYRAREFTALVTHGWTRSTEIDPNEGTRRDVPLTPDQTASFTLMWEIEGGGRLGFEGYYTGRQSLDENPYRSTGRSYVLLGALAERKLGRMRLFINAENLLDVRQTRDDPLVLRAPRPDGRWTVDAWAPLDGRVVNGGIRVQF